MWGDNMTIKNCRLCGTEFEAYSNAQQYCPRCKKEGIPRKPKMERYDCAWCGKTFFSDRKKKYCCVDCRLKRNGMRKGSRKKHTQNFMSIEEVARESSKLGMSAGEYMTKFCYGKEG